LKSINNTKQTTQHATDKHPTAPSFGQPPPTRPANQECGRRAFAVVGPTVWNALGNNLRDTDLSIASFGRLLKTHLFQQFVSAVRAACAALLFMPYY